MNGLGFDWTVRLDSVLVALSMIATGGVVWGTLRADLRALTDKVRQVEGAVAQQTSMLVDMARQDQQLKDHDRRLSALEK